MGSECFRVNAPFGSPAARRQGGRGQRGTGGRCRLRAAGPAVPGAGGGRQVAAPEGFAPEDVGWLGRFFVEAAARFFSSFFFFLVLSCVCVFGGWFKGRRVEHHILDPLLTLNKHSWSLLKIKGSQLNPMFLKGGGDSRYAFLVGVKGQRLNTIFFGGHIF